MSFIDGIKVWIWKIVHPKKCPLCGAKLKVRGYRDYMTIIYCCDCGFEEEMTDVSNDW